MWVGASKSVGPRATAVRYRCAASSLTPPPLSPLTSRLVCGQMSATSCETAMDLNGDGNRSDAADGVLLHDVDGALLHAADGAPPTKIARVRVAVAAASDSAARAPGRLALPFERLELLGVLMDRLARADCGGESARSVAVPPRLMLRVLAVALTSEHSLAATREAVDAARLVLGQLAVPHTPPPAVPDAHCIAPKASWSDAPPERPPSGAPLERAPVAVLTLVCEWLDEDDVLGGLFHASRRMRRFVCAADSLALSTLRVRPGPQPAARFLAPRAWGRLRAVRMPDGGDRIPLTPFESYVGLHSWSDRVGRLSALLRRLNLNECVRFPGRIEGLTTYQGIAVCVAVPAVVWPGLEELALTAGPAVPHANCVGTLAAPPRNVPALRRLALQAGYIGVPRALAYLTAAAFTAPRLHSLVLCLDDWNAGCTSALAQVAPRLESLRLEFRSLQIWGQVALPPLPRVKWLAIKGWKVTLTAFAFPELEVLTVCTNFRFAAPPTEPGEDGTFPGKEGRPSGVALPGTGGQQKGEMRAAEWSLPKLRALTASMGVQWLPRVVAAAPRLEELRLVTARDQGVATEQLPHLLASCTQHSLSRVEVVADWSAGEKFRAPAMDAVAVAKTVQAVLQLPALRHFTCCECVPAFIDWAAVTPTLQSFMWCYVTVKAPPRPPELPQHVEWASSCHFPHIVESPTQWWVHAGSL